MSYKMRTGIIAGRYHSIYGMNCQDSLDKRLFKHDGEIYYAGVLADGCGEGAKSEVGANLATKFLSEHIEILVKRNFEPEDVPNLLFKSLLQFLESIVKNFFPLYTDQYAVVDFIKDHLLFTVFGFLIAPKKTVVFSIGDGVILINDAIEIIEENNQPNYISYLIVNDEHLLKNRSEIPKEFCVKVIPNDKLKRLAIGTDAWIKERDVLLELFDEKSTVNIQRKMNILSKKEKRFKDDAAIIAVTKS